MNLGEVVAAVRAGSGDVESHRLPGGMNNAAYAVVLPDGQRACCKVYRTDDRHRDEREWRALCLLRDAGAEFAPSPLHYEPGAVLMSFADGEPLGGASLDRAQLFALSERLQRLCRIPVPSGVPPVVGAPALMVGRVRQIHGAIEPHDDAMVAAGRWLATTEPDELNHLELSVFGRGDPNLANCLWRRPDMTLIDWEYSGRSNCAFELADLIEHIQSRATSDETWNTLVGTFDFSAFEERTLAISRRLLSVFWLLLLQPGHEGATLNPPESRTVQSERVLSLLNTSH